MAFLRREKNMIIDISTLGLFAISAAVLTLIPGADMLCALSNAVSQGTKAGPGHVQPIVGLLAYLKQAFAMMRSHGFQTYTMAFEQNGFDAGHNCGSLSRSRIVAN